MKRFSLARVLPISCVVIGFSLLPTWLNAKDTSCQTVLSDPKTVDTVPQLSANKSASVVFDASVGNHPIVSSANYEEVSGFGNALTANAIARYVSTKNYLDGHIDIFVPEQSYDADPSAYPLKVYEIVTFYGSQFRKASGMKRNPDAKKAIRLFIMNADWRPSTARKIPDAYFKLAQDIAEEFAVPVAITKDFITIDAEGQVEHQHTGEKVDWFVF